MENMTKKEERERLFLAILIRKYGEPVGVEGEKAYSLTLPFSEVSKIGGVEIYPADGKEAWGVTEIALFKDDVKTTLDDPCDNPTLNVPTALKTGTKCLQMTLKTNPILNDFSSINKVPTKTILDFLDYGRRLEDSRPNTHHNPYEVCGLSWEECSTSCFSNIFPPEGDSKGVVVRYAGPFFLAEIEAEGIRRENEKAAN